MDFLERSARVYPEKTAVIYDDLRRTYPEMLARVYRFANLLRSLDVHPGDRVAVLLPNAPQLLEAHFAVPLAGAQNPAVFSSTGTYEFKIDTTGTATASITYTITFSPASGNGMQTATMKSGNTTLGSGPTGPPSTTASSSARMVRARTFSRA